MPNVRPVSLTRSTDGIEKLRDNIQAAAADLLRRQELRVSIPADADRRVALRPSPRAQTSPMSRFLLRSAEFALQRHDRALSRRSGRRRRRIRR